MQPPQLFFAFSFYVGSAAFAVVAVASVTVGANWDLAVLRGVQAFLAFIFVGWVAETIARTAPPRQITAGADDAASEAAAVIPTATRRRTPFAELREPPSDAAPNAQATEGDGDAKVVQLPSAGEESASADDIDEAARAA